jgi:uncharacterized membrane protein YGL010W
MSDKQWFDLYGESHQNKINKRIHFLCVPAILFSLLGLLHSLSQEDYLDLSFSLNWLLITIGLIFYIRVNWKLGLITIAMSLLMMATFSLFASPQILLTTSIYIFVIAWIFQFIGHKIEGKKPSFFQDLSFLLVGPLWVSDHLTQQKLRLNHRKQHS